ncbi:MAG: hypothetical protein BGN86_16670 [Caulobacterales bacterium 68-7]|nr:hypothetical protein [Caulobacterales bacterium]OJU09838.1 MAG: hypothetical protein BGN86_16670 [Caulobacterales bacterium 68-7]
MTEESAAAPTSKTPWHFWLVGVLALLWNGFGAYDFTMSFVKGDAYYRSMGMTETAIAYMHAMPTWMYVVWVVGVWGAVLGTILLLARRKLATLLFAASLAGAAISAAYQYLTAPEGPGPMPAVIVVIAAFLFWYAGRLSKKGVLR